MLTISEYKEPSKFVSQYWLSIPLGGNNFYLKRTGIVLLDYYAQNPTTWNRETLELTTLKNPIYKEYPPATPGAFGKCTQFTPQHWTVFAAPATIDLQGTTGGVGVDKFDLLVHGDFQECIPEVRLQLTVQGGYHLYRLAYEIDIVGQFILVDNYPIN